MRGECRRPAPFIHMQPAPHHFHDSSLHVARSDIFLRFSPVASLPNMSLLVFLILTVKQMLNLSLHQVWYHGGNMHTLLGEGYWIVMASVDG